MASALAPKTSAPASRSGIAGGDPGEPGNGDRAGHDAEPRGQRMRQFFGRGVGRVAMTRMRRELSSWRAVTPTGWRSARRPGTRPSATALRRSGCASGSPARSGGNTGGRSPARGLRADAHAAVAAQALGANAQRAAGIGLHHGECLAATAASLVACSSGSSITATGPLNGIFFFWRSVSVSITASSVRRLSRAQVVDSPAAVAPYSARMRSALCSLQEIMRGLVCCGSA